ncbi:hypothetical protein D3C81_609580 [compost metagenome]
MRAALRRTHPTLVNVCARKTSNDHQHRPSSPHHRRRPRPGRIAAARRQTACRRSTQCQGLHPQRRQRRTRPGFHAVVDTLRPARQFRRSSPAGRDGAGPRVHPRGRRRHGAHRCLPRLDRQAHHRWPATGHHLLVPLHRPGRQHLAGRPHAHLARRRCGQLQTRPVLLRQPAHWLVQRLCARCRARGHGSVAARRRLHLRIRHRVLQAAGQDRRAQRPAGTRSRDGVADRLPHAPGLLPRGRRPAETAPDGADGGAVGRPRNHQRQLGRRRAEPPTRQGR